jgi:hypothetical protein
MNILLIDTRVSHSEAIVAAIYPGLSVWITFDYYTDTFDTLKDRILLAIYNANATLANSVGLVQHNYRMSTFKFVDAQTTSSIIEQVETRDKELTTWAPLKEFIEWCKTELSTAHFDMMACALYSNPEWKYVIDTLSVQTGVEIRTSTDDTGASSLGGNWFLESHVGVNLKEVYFNDSIDDYMGLLLGTPTISKTYGTTDNPITIIPQYGLVDFPVLNSFPIWTIDIYFTSTGRNGEWRALLGSMYYYYDSRATPPGYTSSWGVYRARSAADFLTG